MCSCFPGYAIMADGISCEGEYRGGGPHTCANLSWPVVGAPEGRWSKRNELKVVWISDSLTSEGIGLVAVTKSPKESSLNNSSSSCHHA